MYERSLGRVPGKLFVSSFFRFGARDKGLFTNYVDKFLAYFDHLPPCVDMFYLINVDKIQHFWTT